MVLFTVIATLIVQEKEKLANSCCCEMGLVGVALVVFRLTLLFRMIHRRRSLLERHQVMSVSCGVAAVGTLFLLILGPIPDTQLKVDGSAVAYFVLPVVATWVVFRPEAE